jgi:hypothetical protein
MFGNCYSNESEELCKQFLTGDTYGLNGELATLWSQISFGQDGQKMSYWDGREHRQMKSLETFEAICSGTLVPNANDMERGLLLLSVCFSYWRYATSSQHWHMALCMQRCAIDVMRSCSSPAASLEQQALFVENYRMFCDVMSRSETEDGYHLMANRQLCESLLLEETNRLQRMFNLSTGAGGKEAASEALKRSKRTLKRLGYLCKRRW